MGAFFFFSKKSAKLHDGHLRQRMDAKLPEQQRVQLGAFLFFRRKMKTGCANAQLRIFFFYFAQP